MKTALLLSVLLIASASAQASMGTAAERCVILADYAKGVADLRDAGVRLAAIKEINAERSEGVMLEAFDQAAAITYRYSHLSPDEVRGGLLTGCMQTVNGDAR
jgi:beta-phosphoglucomutase-like phosphatase (HAD superfamily)